MLKTPLNEWKKAKYRRLVVSCNPTRPVNENDRKIVERYDEVLDVVDVSGGLVLVCETGNSRLNSRASLVVRDTGEEVGETFVYYSVSVYSSKDEMLKTIMDRYEEAA